MKTDRNGCSTCPPGGEQWEEYTESVYPSPRAYRAVRVQYDYRTPDGILFSCIAKSLEAARAKRDAWLAKRQQEA